MIDRLARLAGAGDVGVRHASGGAHRLQRRLRLGLLQRLPLALHPPLRPRRKVGAVLGCADVWVRNERVE